MRHINLQPGDVIQVAHPSGMLLTITAHDANTDPEGKPSLHVDVADGKAMIEGDMWSHGQTAHVANDIDRATLWISPTI